MKRLPLLVLLSLVFTLAACNQPQPVSADFEGQWTGNTTSGSATVPMTFELGRNGKIVEDSFEASYQSEFLDFTIKSYATGKSLSVEATATTSAGDSVRFVLDGIVNGDEITGQYRLDITVDGSTTSINGDFTLVRVAPTT